MYSSQGCGYGWHGDVVIWMTELKCNFKFLSTHWRWPTKLNGISCHKRGIDWHYAHQITGWLWYDRFTNMILVLSNNYICYRTMAQYLDSSEWML